jgi:hypothetical protein
MTDPPDVLPVHDPERELERAIIDGFLRERGLDPAALKALPDDERKHVLEQASIYAAGKLAEIEARAHYVGELHRTD